MKKVWKWIIGIAVVLVVAGLVVFGVLMVRFHNANLTVLRQSVRQSVQAPATDEELRVWNGRYPGMMPFGVFERGGRSFHMVRPGFGIMGHGMMGIGSMSPLGWICRALFRIGLLALLVLGIIWLVRRSRFQKAAVAPVVAAVPVESASPAAAPVAASQPCPKCGETVQAGWKHCPNCGKKL